MAAKKVTAKVVSIPPIQIENFEVTIEGISSLICHNFSDRSMNEILNKQMKKAVASKAPKDPEQDYRDSMYITETGMPGFPTKGIKKACVGAAYTYVSSIPKTQARGAFFVFPVDPGLREYAPIVGEPRMRRDRVLLQGRTADIRHRAEFLDWTITVRIMHNPRVISQEGILNLLENAGFHIGLGEMRPGKSGHSHGMFRVKRG